MKQHDIEVVERGGFYHARRRGTAGQVIHRSRQTAIERAKELRSRHRPINPELPKRADVRYGTRAAFDGAEEAA